MLMYWFTFAVFATAAILYQSADRRVIPSLSGAAPLPARRSSAAPAAVALFLLVIIGLRYRVGGDWANYMAVYRAISAQDFERAMATSLQEPAYTFINWISAQLGAGMWLVNLLCAVPFVVGLVLQCRQQPNFWLALLVATPFLIIVVGMGYTRQAAALGFLLIGSAGLINKSSMLRFVGWVLVGSLFHRTVLLFVPLILMATGRKRGTLFLLGLLTIVIGYYTVLPSALERYGPGYIHNQYNAAGATVRVIMNLVPAALLLVTGDRFYGSLEEKIVWRTFAVMAVLAAMALPLVPSSVIVDRLSIYLIPVQIFVLARLPYTGVAGNSAAFWKVIIIIYTGAVMFVWLNYAVNAYSWIPYRNYLQGPQ